VCGFDAKEFIWGENGSDPSWIICSCCGTEFGYEDSQLSAVKNARSKWIQQGYTWDGKNWFDKESKPENWKPDEQMKNIPEEFR